MTKIRADRGRERGDGEIEQGSEGDKDKERKREFENARQF